MRAALVALALVAVVVWVSHALDRPPPAAAAGQGRPPAGPLAGAATRPAAAAPPAAGGQLPVAGLAPGACWALPPTAAGRGRTVFIDPGHGGLDPGASGNGVVEKQASLAVALRLADLLRGDGWRVVLARTTDSSVVRLSDSDVDSGSLRASALHRDLVGRIACANAARAAALLSVHFNGFGDSAVGGTETFYDTDRPFADGSQRLAQSLQAALVRELGLTDRGVTADTDLDASAITEAGTAYGHLLELGPAMPGWVDTPTAMPGALVEPLFLTNPEEAYRAGMAEGQQRIAQALYEGLKSYLGSS